ncbi:hypothetical protein C6N75_15830 [Streptomyces solincola]|uniref:Uncharacterized protein n=1 Tax=Streptomyces solincola TaxID=2100817 RepID=A0A2S9PV21_9ACTN|nr:hypothetical protein C6N75_15830 [Streptomyces solincola]
MAGGGLVGAAPASAGGTGSILSPAFGVTCANLDNGARANGVTRSTDGSLGGNLAGVPLGSALNQCGGADYISKYGDVDIDTILPSSAIFNGYFQALAPGLLP